RSREHRAQAPSLAARKASAVPVAGAGLGAARRHGLPVLPGAVLQLHQLLAAVSQSLPLRVARQLHQPGRGAAVRPRTGIHAGIHAGGGRGPGRAGACGGAVPACAHSRPRRDPRADAPAADDTAGDHRADVEDHDGIDQRRHPQLPAVVPGRRSRQLVRLHAGGDRLGPDHRHLGQPAVRRPDPAGRGAGPAHTPVRGAPRCGARPIAILRYVTLPLLSPFIVLVVLFRTMDSLRIFDVIYATTLGGPNDATTNLHIMAYQYSFQWYQMGKGMAQAIVLLILVVMISYLLMRLWNRASESTA